MIDDLDQDTLLDEAANLRRQTDSLEARLQTLQRRNDTPTDADPERLRLICPHIAAWVESASSEEWTQVLEALQISVIATRMGRR